MLRLNYIERVLASETSVIFIPLQRVSQTAYIDISAYDK
jgi:hypothetical protein